MRHSRATAAAHPGPIPTTGRHTSAGVRGSKPLCSQECSPCAAPKRPTFQLPFAYPRPPRQGHTRTSKRAAAQHQAAIMCFSQAAPPVEIPLKIPVNFTVENMPFYAFATRQRLKRELIFAGNLFTWKGLLCSGTVKPLHMGRKMADGSCQWPCARTRTPLHGSETGAWLPITKPELKRAKLSYLHDGNSSSDIIPRKKSKLTAEEGNAPLDLLIDADC